LIKKKQKGGKPLNCKIKSFNKNPRLVYVFIALKNSVFDKKKLQSKLKYIKAYKKQLM
jgi:hypothetical protein